MKLIKDRTIEFLQESNEIEDVHDTDSLDQAIYAWEYLISQKEISIGVILKAHKILMLHKFLRPNEKGYFRKCPVYIDNKECLDWEKIEKEIRDGIRQQFKKAILKKIVLPNGNTVLIEVTKEFLSALKGKE
jgi:hypothetical protein